MSGSSVSTPPSPASRATPRPGQRFGHGARPHREPHPAPGTSRTGYGRLLRYVDGAGCRRRARDDQAGLGGGPLRQPRRLRPASSRGELRRRRRGVAGADLRDPRAVAAALTTPIAPPSAPRARRPSTAGSPATPPTSTATTTGWRASDEGDRPPPTGLITRRGASCHDRQRRHHRHRPSAGRRASLTIMREASTPNAEFRAALDGLAGMLVYEATQHLPSQEVKVRPRSGPPTGGACPACHARAHPAARRALASTARSGSCRRPRSASSDWPRTRRRPPLPVSRRSCGPARRPTLLVLDPMLATGER